MTGLRRFTFAPERLVGDRVVFDRDETLHLARVLRLRPGDLVIAADGRGRDYTVRLDTVAHTATGTVLGAASRGTESPLDLTLLQAVLKGDKMESIIRAATELGVARVWPIITERTIVRLEPSRWRERARRWQRVAREAAKQCGRTVIPEIETPQAFAACVQASRTAELKVCLWEGQAPLLATVLGGMAGRPSAVMALVGPEGGLARAEVETAGAAGWTLVSLGPRILRSETAGPTIVAILQSRFGDLGGPQSPSAPER